jgi:hypothetical protein
MSAPKSKISPGDTHIESRTTQQTTERGYKIDFESRGQRSQSTGRRIDVRSVTSYHSMPSNTLVETRTGSVQTRRTERRHQHGSGPVHIPTNLGRTPGETAAGFRATTLSAPVYGKSTTTETTPVIKTTKWK